MTKEPMIEITIKLDPKWVELLKSKKLTEEQVLKRIETELKEYVGEEPISVYDDPNTQLGPFLSVIGELEKMDIVVKDVKE